MKKCVLVVLFCMVILFANDFIKSNIEDEFEGYEEGNIYVLDNGQIWRQTDYKYHYHYRYRPEVIIYKDGYAYYMIVEGMNSPIKVEQLNVLFLGQYK